jgi:tetratricopeptide (TPR) repeat protein
MGRLEEARSVLVRAMPADPRVVQDSAVLLEVAVRLADRELVAKLAEGLRGSARRTGVVYFDNTCVARHLGDAMRLLERNDEARAYYEQAVEVCARVRHRPELALTRLSLAELLLAHYPDERHAAIEHLDFAIAELREMKMQPSLERALRHRGLLKA